MGLWADAQADFERAIADRKAGTDLYHRLRVFLCRARRHEFHAAAADLRVQARLSPDLDPWGRSLAATLAGDSSPDSLVARAETPGARCEAWFYAGMRRLLTGDRGGAARDLRECVETGCRTWTEWRSAIAEIERLSR
jgi:lipoprotein NlpI